MNKKSTSKLVKFLTQNLVQRSKVILLGIILASLFLPFVSSEVLAQGVADTGIRTSTPTSSTSTTTITNNTNNLASQCQVSLSNFVNSSNALNISKTSVGISELFDIYFAGEVNPDLGAKCLSEANSDYVISVYLYVAPGCTSLLAEYNYRITFPVSIVKDSQSGKYYFRKQIKDVSIEKVFKNVSQDLTGPDIGRYCLYAYWHQLNETPSSTQYFSYNGYLYKSDSNSNPVTLTLNYPEQCSFDSCKVVDNRVSVPGSSLGIKFLTQDGKGLRDKYRVAITDSESMTFGVTKGLDGVSIDWDDGTPKLAPNQYIALNSRNDTSGIPNQNPQYKYTNVIFAYSDAKWDGTKACQGASLGNDTCDVLFYQFSKTNNDKGERDINASQKVLSTAPVTLNPVLKIPAWRSKITNAKSSNGEPLGKVEFIAVPIVWAVGGLSGTGSIYVIGNSPPKFTVEVYENEQQIIDACKKENSGNEAICTPEYARYGIGNVVETATSSSEKDAEGSLTGDLFDFLRKIIGYIVLLMTSFIYWIFSTILVPVIVSLLQIHPYKDEFVNFVYPGWIIIRNISNIVFIVALLYMGLKILIQQEDAAKSRSFIVTLILMALLLNFSLVIGQSIVAIADTVQAQFLPENSEVVETLAHKLMVDPIVVFRGGDDSKLSLGDQKADAYASDLPKAIVLLVLAIAAFFSFVALIAFMFVRLVALWVLYMLSPLAYVGRILPETKKYANEWWSEFIKYAFSVPILAFFLNIAALMAVTFSAQTGDQVQVQGARGYLFGSAAAGITEFALTVVSHFIVLLFLFIGMKYALKFGGFGAKQIVDAAKGGFDFVTKTAPKYAGNWAKDTGSDWGAAKLTEKGKPGLATALRAVARPLEFGKALKKGYFDKPKELMDKRFADDFGKRANQLQPWGEDKLFPLKWAAWKMTGQSGKALMGRAEKLSKMTGIMDDSEVSEKKDELVNAQDRVEELKSGELQIDEVKSYLEKLNEKLAAADQKISEAKDYDSRKKAVEEYDQIKDHRDALNSSIESAELAGKDKINLTAEVNDAVLQVHDLDGEKVSLEAKITNLDELIKADEKLRDDTGFTGKMDDARRKELQKEVEELSQKADAHSRPVSRVLEKDEASDVAKAKKEISELELDYDQLEDGLASALKKNNLIQARAFLKQIADIGMMKKLLSNKGYQYNVQGLEKLVRENFKGSNRSQLNIIREVSKVTEKNGNLPLAYAVKSLPNGGGVMKTYNQQMEDVGRKVKKLSAKDMKKDDIIHVDPNTGQESVVKGTLDWAKANNSPEKAKVVERDINPEVAAEIYKAVEASGEPMPHIKDALSNAVGKTKQN